MTGELVLSVLQGPDEARGCVAGIAVTDQMIVALGGASTPAPTLVVSSDARHFEPRMTPRNLGLHDVIAVGDSLWACGEHGQLAVSRDHGVRWKLLETGTDGTLLALAMGADGAIWVVGEAGYAARVLGEAPRRVDLGTTARLASVHAVRDEIVMLGGDGVVRRWRDGEVTTVVCGSERPLTGLAITGQGTWVVVGDGGFVARSPDGTWYARVSAGIAVDLEAIGVLPDGTLAIVGDRGQLALSADDGRTWRSVAHELGLAHLWSIERFGRGVLIGGDDGLIARLAPPDDATWYDRARLAHPEVAHADASRAAELCRTPRTRWSELAWRWLDDGIAHRALLARLDQAQRAQLAAIDELGELGEGERAVALPRLAAELSAELEAVLVGSLVRNDPLDDVRVRPAAAADPGDHGGAPGWAAIDRALLPISGDAEPLPSGAVVPYGLGGDDPIHGIQEALAMTERGLRLQPDDADLQFTHAMLLLDAERAGDGSAARELLASLARSAPEVRIHVAVRMAKAGHARFADAAELALSDPPPAQLLDEAPGAELDALEEVSHEMLGELGEAVLVQAPHLLGTLVPRLPDDAVLLCALAGGAIDAGQREVALALYDRIVALAVPDDDGERASYLRALHDACVQARGARALDAAVRLADRAQPLAHEDPYLYHAAACAYAAVDDLARALEQVKLAIEHDYEHVARIEADAELGALLAWPELHALFRDWHARREGN
jgi:hypothetical protein